VQTDSLEYAVKGEGAALPMFNQYISMAKLITSGIYTGSTIQDYMQELRAQASKRNELYESALNSKEAAINFILQDLEKYAQRI
jgi:hypothetical protein